MITTLTKVISGGQTGADVGGLLAAKLHGIKVGGWMTHGWRTQSGPKPEYADLFGMAEHSDPGYKGRTWQNIRDADLTVRIAVNLESPGEKYTLAGCKTYDKPCYDVPSNKMCPKVVAEDVRMFVNYIHMHEVKTLNVAGNSHKTWGGMQAYTVKFLSATFFMLGYDYAPLDSRYNSFTIRTW